MSGRVFADNVAAYALAGWPCILPVPRDKKHPPPVGFTGADGRDTDPLTLVAWAGTHAGSAIALRMPDGVIGIDVDHYDKGDVQKRGADTLAEYVERWGPLPATWSSTARGSDEAVGPSRIMFFRVPAGRYATKLGDAIEIIQRHHRYAVVAPSPHTETGGTYRWYGPDGLPAGADLPKPNELPELPEAWVRRLTEGATEVGPAAADVTSGEALLGQVLADTREPCADVTSAALTAHNALTEATTGGRHDAATARVHHLVQLGAAGHPGVGTVVGDLRGQWETLTAGEDRADEFERMLLTSARKAVTARGGTRQVDRDPCLLAQGLVWQPPAPAGDAPAAAEAPRWWSIREIIGTHAFDPRADLDQTLAQAVLERTYPAMRFAWDANTWLLRGSDRWDARGDLAGWAVAELASLMPMGNPDGEKGSDDRRRADRRKRMMTTAGANAVAAKMRALVAGGGHPCALRLTDLDDDPEVLWAGGVAWNLRASIDRPVEAGLDPSTPHLHSAAVLPDPETPTPLWDAFVSAVWPDPDIRAWALRVLAISLTGYPDAALPILLGPTRRGKSQIVTLLMSILGTYAHAADARLLSGTEQAHASIIYALKGRRLSYIDEGPRRGFGAQERLKQLTGGAPLTGNRMRENPVTFDPTHTLILTANPEAEVSLTDPAIRARVRLIPCDGDEAAVRATRAAIGPISGATWRNEAPGVLAAMMLEAAAWLAEVSSATTAAAPVSIRHIADELASEQDPARQWLEAEAVPDEVGTRSTDLYKTFVSWCRDTGVKNPPSMTKWGTALTEGGFDAIKRDGVKFRPLRLRAPGGWSPLLPTVPDSSGTVEGRFSGQPSTGQTRTSEPVSGQSLGQLDSCVATTTTTSKYKYNKEKKENIDAIGEVASTVPGPLPHTTSDLRQDSSEQLSGELSGWAPPEQPDEPPTFITAKTTKGRVSVDRKLVKERERQAKIEQAAGEPVPLPALVGRDGQVQAIPLAEVGPALASAIERSGALTVDVETSGYPVGHRDYALRTIQLGDAQAAVVLDAGDPAQTELANIALGAAPRLHAHSATADLVPLAHAALIDAEGAWGRMHDTVIPAKLADPASTGSDPGLKQLAQAVLGEQATAPAADEARAALFKAGRWLTDTRATTPLTRSGWAQVPMDRATMVRYGASDVLDTAALARVLPSPDSAVLSRERAVQRLTARVAHVGVRIDGEHVSELLSRHTAHRTAAAERVRAFGVDNPGSGSQVAAKLVELGADLPRTAPSSRHPDGQPSVAEGVLDPLLRSYTDGTPVHTLVKAVLDYRHHDTAIGTFLEPYLQLVQHGDGRARPTVYTLGADTGRMSCVRPNLQQVPRTGGFRACITADPGQLLVSADFSGVEIRVMAALSGDTNLRRQLEQGVDLHTEIAKQVFGPNWTKGDRYMVKRGVFGWAYGGGVATLAKQVGASESAMASVVDVLSGIAPEYVAWSHQIRAAARAGRTQFSTYAGRVIHLPADYPHKAANYCIQGTARELLVDALLRWRETPWGSAVLLPVHDEIVVAVPEADADAALAALVAAMETELFGIGIRAEASTPSFAWADSA